MENSILFLPFFFFSSINIVFFFTNSKEYHIIIHKINPN